MLCSKAQDILPRENKNDENAYCGIRHDNHPSLCCRCDKRNGEYEVYQVKASQVEGVSITLSKEFTRKDCNQISIQADETPVYGNIYDEETINWHTTYFVSAFAISTEMYCPIDEPVQEVVFSEPIRFDSYTNENLDREVLIQVIVPKGYDLNVETY